MPASSSSAAVDSQNHGLFAAAMEGDKGEVVAEQPAKKRRLVRRSTEQQVERAIAEHFGNVSQVDKFHKIFEGKSLHATIAEHKRMCKQSKGRMGSMWWAAMKKQFGVGEVAAELKVENPKHTINPDLVKALGAATCANPAKRNIQGLQKFLQTVDSLNQKERVGITRFFLERRIQADKRGRDLFVTFSKAMFRCGQHTSAEVSFVKDLIDESYCHLWTEYSKQKIDEMTFLRLHRDGLLSVVVVEADLDAVLAAKGSWGAVSANLAALTDGSQIGRKLFNHACEAMAHEKVSIRMGTLMDNVPHSLTKAGVAALHSQLKAFLERQTFSIPRKRRKISLKFGILPLDLCVNTPKEEFDLRLSALIKSSVAKGALELLPFGEGLPRHPDIVLQCDEDVIVGMRAVRQAASQALKEVGADDLDAKSALAALQSKLSVLKSMDSGFAIELSILEAIGAEGGEVLIQNMILARLLSEGGDDFTISQAAESLLSMVASPLYKFIGERARSFLDLSLEAIRAMQAGEAPPVAKLSQCAGPFWTAFLKQLPWFASLVVVAEDGSESIIFGPSSLTARLAECQQNSTANTLKFQDLSELDIFEHWLSATEKDAARRLTDALLQAMSATKKAPQARASASKGTRFAGRPEAKRKARGGLKAASAAADEDAAVLSLFG